MPTQQCRGTDDPEVPSIPRKQPRQRGEQHAVSMLQMWTRDLASQHHYLVAQDQQLDVFRGFSATAQNDQREQR
jgi:hypothetical protein